MRLAPKRHRGYANPSASRAQPTMTFTKPHRVISERTVPYMRILLELNNWQKKMDVPASVIEQNNRVIKVLMNDLTFYATPQSPGTKPPKDFYLIFTDRGRRTATGMPVYEWQKDVLPIYPDCIDIPNPPIRDIKERKAKKKG